jgi:hypothetical protein
VKVNPKTHTTRVFWNWFHQSLQTDAYASLSFQFSPSSSLSPPTILMSTKRSHSSPLSSLGVRQLITSIGVTNSHHHAACYKIIIRSTTSINKRISSLSMTHARSIQHEWHFTVMVWRRRTSTALVACNKRDSTAPAWLLITFLSATAPFYK